MPSDPRSVLITGGCGDIGRALAAEFAASGYQHVALCDLLTPADAEPRLAALQRHGCSVMYRQVDVTDPDAVTQFVDDAAARAGRLDLCIGNAGIVERAPLTDLSPQAWRRTLDVNLTGCYLTARAAANAMTRTPNDGHILFLGSWTQDVPREGIGAYCVSKAGLHMLAKCLALELGPRGIRVNVAAAGFVDAGLTAQNLRRNPDRRPAIQAEVPLGRLLPPDELARAIRLFCSPDAAYVTGTTFLIDGGASLSYRPRPGT